MPSTDGVLRIKTPNVFLPLLKPSRYKGAYGGRGSGKSHAFADLLIERCLLRQPTRAVCIREIQRSLEQSVKRLLEDKIKEYNIGNQFRVLHTHIETPGDGLIIFQGMQTHNAETIKSLEAYDVAWVEEAQSLSQRSLDLLRPTIRQPESEIWLSWNPKTPKDPVEKLLRSGETPPNSIVVKANYKDNPFFPDVLRTEMEWDRSRDTDKYQHVWEGEYENASELQVFKNWKIEEFDVPSDASLMFGGDWGYSVDPAVLSGSFVKDRTLYIAYESYQIGCEVDYLPMLFDGVACGCQPTKQGKYMRPCTNQELHGLARNWTSTVDSARPETISYMQRHGYPKMVAAIKGKDSVKEGVIFLQNYDIRVHPRCVHTIDELTYYSYKKDKLTEEVLPILEDKKNHVIDSLRYAVEKLRAAYVPSFVTW